jgi:serine/threonine-protein kinase ULK/ATG1
LKTLKHKHIVTFIEEFEQGNKVYIVTEFCEEGDLSKYLKGRTLSKEEVLRITAEILEGLFYIHSQGYMHRDLKP